VSEGTNSIESRACVAWPEQLERPLDCLVIEFGGDNRDQSMA
jgi:hypothetical protein